MLKWAENAPGRAFEPAVTGLPRIRPMQRWARSVKGCSRILLLISLVASTLLSACSAATPTPPAAPTPRTTAPDIVTAEAIIQPQRQTTLSPKAIGRVVAVLVTEGDTVQAGQALLKLDSRDLEQAVAQADAGARSARAQLARLRSGARPEDLAVAEAAVAVAQAAARAAEAAVNAGKGNLLSAQAVLPSAQAAYQQILNGADADQLAAAHAAVEQARVLVSQAQQAYDRVKDQPNAGMTPQALQLQQATINFETAQAQYRVVSRGAAQAEIAAAQARVFQAQAAIQIAEAQVQQLQAQAEAATGQARQAQAQLDLLRTGARAEEIAVAEAAVAQAEASLARARSAFDDATLTAPFAGVVGALWVNEGELASPQVPALRLGDLSRLQAQTQDLSEVDVARVQIGQSVQVTVDALSGKAFGGHVLRIVPQATDRRGDKVYTVIVALDEQQPGDLRWGMSALVEIEAR